jgi:ankyrin repeat protein
MLMDAGAVVEAQVFDQTTPLHFATQNGHAEVCRVLIMEAGAAIEAQDALQFTPLHGAAEKGHVEICRILMRAKAVADASKG